MSIDLVTRLRDHERHACHDHDDDCAEAADEIERLRAVVMAADALRGTGYEPRPATAKVQAYDAAREVLDRQPDPDFYVIAKTYADEPRRLWATVEDGALLVANDTKEAWIGYPSKLIFEYEETLFTQMRSAFASGSTEKLAQLWGAARHLDG